MIFRSCRTWRNHTGNQRCRPREQVAPGSLKELVELVQRAERDGTTVHAVGAGHSWSDVALTDGYLVEPTPLGGLRELHDGTLKDAARVASLARVGAGIHLHELNPALDARAKRCRTWAATTRRRSAGSCSTSTHGSGLEWGPLGLVVAGGEV